MRMGQTGRSEMYICRRLTFSLHGMWLGSADHDYDQLELGFGSPSSHATGPMRAT